MLWVPDATVELCPKMLKVVLPNCVLVTKAFKNLLKMTSPLVIICRMEFFDPLKHLFGP